MGADNVQEQLIKYLADAHSIEEQALQQLKKAPNVANDPAFATALEEHRHETERHEQLTRERLEQLGASPSRFKDLVMRAGGEGFVWFARSQPDTTGKLATHAFSYEGLEVASYELLLRVAMRAGDHETARIAREIRDDERRMLERIDGLWDGTVEAALQEVGRDDISDRIPKYLADAHALEKQAEGLLENGPKLVDDGPLAGVFEHHLEETRHHRRLVEERLEALDSSPSKLKDVQMKIGALNWGGFFAVQPDTVGKLNAFSFAFEHLEIGGYEQLRRVARRAGDEATAATAERILAQEREAASKLAAQFDHTAEASLRALGVSPA